MLLGIPSSISPEIPQKKCNSIRNFFTIIVAGIHPLIPAGVPSRDVCRISFRNVQFLQGYLLQKSFPRSLKRFLYKFLQVFLQGLLQKFLSGFVRIFLQELFQKFFKYSLKTSLLESQDDRYNIQLLHLLTKTASGDLCICG